MTKLHQEIRFATSADGARIAYAQSGRGYPLVRTAHWMTHVQWDWQTPVWGPWIEALSAHWRLLRYDSRGCGLSDRDTPALALDDLVHDLEAVVDAAGLERFALLGMSQGGAIAIAYAARHPQRVSQLVLCDGFARGALRRGAASIAPQMIDALCCLIEGGWGQENPAFRQLFTSQFFPRADAAQAEAFNDLQRLSCSPTHASRWLRAGGEIDATTELAQVRCPTLVMHGRGDARVPFDEGRFIAAGIAGARFELLDTDNHVPLAGEAAFDAAHTLLRGFLPGADAGIDPAFMALTPRERELLDLVARGLDNMQIAARLGRAEKTVRNNVSALFATLQVESRAQAIVRAREAGFGKASDESGLRSRD